MGGDSQRTKSCFSKQQSSETVLNVNLQRLFVMMTDCFLKPQLLSANLVMSQLKETDSCSRGSPVDDLRKSLPSHTNLLIKSFSGFVRWLISFLSRGGETRGISSFCIFCYDIAVFFVSVGLPKVYYHCAYRCT